MLRAEPGTAAPTRRVQHATTCYVFRFRQKFVEPCFRRKLILNNNLRLFLPWLSWEAPVGLTLCRYRSYVDMIHVVDFEKTALSTPFRGVLAPSGPQISAESGRATRSLAPGKPGWPPMTTWPLFSRPTPRAPHPTSGVRSCADPPRWLLPDTNRRFVKDRTGSNLDERPLYIQYVTEPGDSCGEIDPFFSPPLGTDPHLLATDRLLCFLLWPGAVAARSARFACRSTMYRSARPSCVSLSFVQ